MVPGLRGCDLDGEASWCALLGSRYRRRVVEGVQTVEPVLVESEDAALLGVGSGRAGWRFLWTSRDERGTVVERVDALVRADRYLIEVEITRSRRHPRSRPGSPVRDAPREIGPPRPAMGSRA